jgi:O-acetyl-ADP-ribose deacetylase (regulator of RNase III)
MINRNVFYLVPKPFSKSSKPTYKDITKCLIDMFKQAHDLKITKIAMPKIACGLDGKHWGVVKDLILKCKPDNIDVLIMLG